MSQNNFPKLHNATWPGIVGKGPDSEPIISFDEMLQNTANAEVNGVKFDGVDIGLFDPHVDLDMDDDGIKKLADKVSSLGLEIGSVVAPIWGGPILGTKEDRVVYLDMLEKSCKLAKKLREIGVRPNGIVRIDTASSPEVWAKDPKGSQKIIVETLKEAAKIAEGYGERLAAEGEICWGGMQSWKTMLETLESVNSPFLGFQADMAHTLLYTLGYNYPEHRLLPEGYDWKDKSVWKAALKEMTDALRPWTIDFHVAQNDATVFGSGSHDKTGRHCLANDPNGKLDIAEDAGYWLRDEKGELTKAFKHMCWDGCMFPNEVMKKEDTWNNILAAMISVREKHGWKE
ncbi:sugar phosphate isomerase/epimerase family protein [Cyclobacterium amurskyense]|uniref:Xylose isomerase n=1 Tax=Cyclobacterium amurskyense TaxID=320787 RepID=A0A0H4PD09_9BACT|nr:TIM barrel protein [Cyclobacterium amurskyense]AKP50723.1 Xylose isomerase [Cyclobacterium amurskyense]|tara:strand:+ start:19015 stop:20046 length:1032 start_codon:yes stop_codon:yes gene_type:complete